MLIQLIKHQWLKAVRSATFERGCLTNLILGLIGAYLFFYVILLSFGLESLITNVIGISDSIGFVNQIFIYYIFLELFTRYFMQKIPVIDLQYYLHLPISRKTIIHYLLGKSMISPFNLVVPVMFAPFAFTVVQGYHGMAGAWGWFLTLAGLSWLVHYALILFKRTLGDQIWGVALVLGIMTAFGVLEYYGILAFGSITAPFFELAANSLIPVILVFLLIMGAYLLCYRFYSENSYLDELAPESKSFRGAYELGFLNSFGNIGDLLNLEFKLILRHKRARQSAFLCVFFLLYGLLFYPGMEVSEGGARVMMLFLGIFITGIFIMQYGQFLLSWNSGYFDFFGVNPVSSREYVASKFYLLAGVSLICYLLAMPYVYFGWQVLFVNTAMFLYNIGVNIFIILAMSMWGPQKIDLSKRTAFSFEGVGAAQWLMGIPLLFIPLLLFVPFAIFGAWFQGVLFLGGLGLLGLIFHQKMIELCTRRFDRLRYIIAASFRAE